MPTRSLLPNRQQHLDFVHKQFQAKVQQLNQKYANQLTPEEMMQMQLQHAASTNIAPGAGLSPRSLTAPGMNQFTF
jgi:hypothetical protein